jgi:PAS domain S-box-containing protein
MTHRTATVREAAEKVARSHRPTALGRSEAVVVGNRAGIVEWTSEAFSQLTGFPLSETLDKPITHFLDRAGLEIELVEFVAQHFLEGRPCTLELPFETFDQRSIQVHLEVEPLRDGRGEITRFIAVASDVTERPMGSSPAAAPDSTDLSAAGTAGLKGQRPGSERSVSFAANSKTESIALGERVRAANRRLTLGADSETIIEVILEPGLPRIAGDGLRWEKLLDRLLESALAESDRRPTFVTTLAGRLAPRRSHISQVHPIPARAIPRSTEWRVYLEIHDSGAHLACDLPERIQAGMPGRTSRERMLGQAAGLAAELGLPFYLNSTPGCGTQILLLMPAAEGHARSPTGDAQAMYMPPFAAKT